MSKSLEFTKVFSTIKILTEGKMERTFSDFKVSLLSELMKLDLFNTNAESEKQKMHQKQQIFHPGGSENEKTKKRMV